MKKLIELTGIQKSFPTGDGPLPVLKGIDLTVCHGEFVTIVGSSGSGKSTLMNIIGCLDTPDKGSYLLDGEDVSDLSDRRLSAIRNRKIGFVFQGFHLIQCLTALENVELPLRYRGLSRARRRELAEQALYEVGLAERMHHLPSQLSGGQQQRTAIARAVASHPPVILADEPTGNQCVRRRNYAASPWPARRRDNHHPHYARSGCSRCCTAPDLLCRRKNQP